MKEKGQGVVGEVGGKQGKNSVEKTKGGEFLGGGVVSNPIGESTTLGKDLWFWLAGPW